MANSVDWQAKTLELFAEGLYRNLKSRVKGHVWCSISNNELKCSIEYRDVTYSFKKKDMIENINKGITVNDVAKEIEYGYTDILRKVFFYNTTVKHTQI